MLEPLFTILTWTVFGIIGMKIICFINEEKMVKEDYMAGIVVGPFGLLSGFLYALAVYGGKLFLKILDLVMNMKGK